MIHKLSFAKGNAKLANDTAIFSLPAGHTCPGALACRCTVNRTTGKMRDGESTVFRCYASSAENLFRGVRESRWRNFELLKANRNRLADFINESLPKRGIKLCRIHSSGDFFSQGYFDAWAEVARRNPQIIFYAYTKALNFWVNRLASIPANFRLVASMGGKYDHLAFCNRLRRVVVVYSEQEAEQLNLPIDHDDTHAWKTDKDFALLLHGTQPAKSQASQALAALRKQGKGGCNADYFASYKKAK